MSTSGPPDSELISLQVGSSGRVRIIFEPWSDGDEHASVLAELDEIATMLREFVAAEGVELHRIVGGCRDAKEISDDR